MAIRRGPLAAPEDATKVFAVLYGRGGKQVILTAGLLGLHGYQTGHQEDSAKRRQLHIHSTIRRGPLAAPTDATKFFGYTSALVLN
jgi:hypothetical protein